MKKPPSEPARRQVLRELWGQEPLQAPPPTSELHLDPNSWVDRGLELMVYAVRNLEYWLSRSGFIRAWLRLNFWFAIVLTAAAVFLIPPVTAVLQQLAASSQWASEILLSLIAVVTSLPPALISIGVLYLIFVVVKWLRRRRLHGRLHDEESYYR